MVAVRALALRALAARALAARALASFTMATGMLGCSAVADPVVANPLLGVAAEQLPSTLNSTAQLWPYLADSTPAPGGQLTGRVTVTGALPGDTLTRPTHDQSICKPVPAAPVQGTADGLGEAVVWLVGVESGPPDRAARRTALTLTGCALSPRVQRVPVGATLIVRSEDAMDARLRILEAGVEVGAPRALVPLETAGALVPLTDVADRPGLLEIRDDRHPWVRGWIAVAPHPFVAVTGSDGTFSFAGVPPGSYALVAWHERLGQRALPVLVELGVETRVVVTLDAP